MYILPSIDSSHSALLHFPIPSALWPDVVLVLSSAKALLLHPAPGQRDVHCLGISRINCAGSTRTSERTAGTHLPEGRELLGLNFECLNVRPKDGFETLVAHQ